MSKSTEIVTMEEAEPPQQPKLNPFSFFPKFNLQLPFLPPKPKPEDDKVSIPNQNQQRHESPKPNLVTFPKTQVVVPSPLQAEVDDELSQNKTSNTYILWQVYALGAIIVSRWIWARWNERKGGGGRSPNDERAERRHSDDGDNE